jgi:hypothetical protein
MTGSGGNGLAAASDPESEAALALIEQSLGHALGPEQRALVADALSWLTDAWRSHRASVPDGTEPDFVFHPTPLSSDSKPTHADDEEVGRVEKASHE